MKTLMRFIITALIATAALAQSMDAYTASKNMIDTTRFRIAAFQNGDLQAVCNYTKSSKGYDTNTYYMSFESYKNRNFSHRLYQDLNPWLSRNYEAMFNRNLPFKLHIACSNKDVSGVKNVLIEMSNIYALE